jgi:predicted permease
MTDGLDQDIRDHLEREIQANVERGMSPEEARYAVLRKFGNIAKVKEDTRAVWSSIWLQQFLQDLAYGLRTLRRSPAFAVTAFIAIALGIGASTAVFSVVDRVLFRSLPYPHPEQLVSVGMLAPSADKNEFFMVPAYLQLEKYQTPFSSMAAFGFISDCDLTEESPVRLQCALVDASYLPTFGIRPLVGRNFTQAEDVPHAAKVALLTFAFWKSRFAGRTDVIGQSISLDGQPTTIVGILPKDFELFNLSHVDLLLPAALDRSQSLRAVRAFGRLKPGVTEEQARMALQPLFAQVRKDVPADFQPGLRLVVRSLKDRQIADIRTASWTLFGAVLLVLLIACANVANLLLGRSVSRRREMAVRLALGAGRLRLMRQSLTESLLLAATGAIAGWFLAWLCVRFFLAIAPTGMMALREPVLNVRVLLFAMVVAVISGVLFGLLQSLKNPDPETLTGGRSITGFRGFARELLIAAQISASLLLLTGAGLLLRTLWSLESVPLGMNAANVVTAQVVLSKTATQARIFSFTADLESKLNQLPGVSAAAISNSVPPSGGVRETPYSALNIEGQPRLPAGTGGGVAWRYITPQYFAALGIPILRGRTFDELDRSAAGSAIILNQMLAQRLFPHGNAIGRAIFESSNGRWHTVIGVAADVRNLGLVDPEIPEYYLVRKQIPDDVFGDGLAWRSIFAVVRSPLNAHLVARQIRSAVAQLDPSVPVTIEPMRERLGALTQRPRFTATLLTVFSIVALLLAAIGIYGVIAFLVAQRTREVGVRLALGATPRIIMTLFLGYAARWTALGVIVGLLGSAFENRLMSTLLFRAHGSALDMGFGISLFLFLVALAAAWFPSRRAALIDPARTLREE